MSPTNSDSDSSPKSPSSSRSSRSGEEEDRKSIPATHPGSPSNAHQSSDESTTSDGVLVELPHNPDHDTRGLQGDPDGGILVNIDGSMHEGREDMFVDAPEDLGSNHSSVALDESLAVIDFGEGEASAESPGSRSGEADIPRMRVRLDEALAQCRKYKEEREVFGKEVSSLRRQLREVFDHRSLPGTSDESVEHAPYVGREGDEDDAFSSPTPLHSMVSDCSKMLSHLKNTLDDRMNLADTTGGLNAVLYTKEKELEDLTLKLTESNMCQDVIISYFSSVRDVWAKSLKESSDEVNKRLLASLETVVGHGRYYVDSSDDMISLFEKKTLFLIEKHAQLVYETQQFKEFLAERRPDLLSLDENELSFVYYIAREELLESQRREAFLLERTSMLQYENQRIAEVVNKMKEELEASHAETNKTKLEFEHAENRLASVREKLSMAVTKGKSLVQQRDALKQSLVEKTSELEKCLLELQQQSEALKTSEARTEQLNQLLSEKTNELDRCLLELQDKCAVLESTEVNAVEKTSELENCLLELQQKSEALLRAEARAEALEKELAEKVGDLDKCLLELKQTSDTLENSETNYREMETLLAEKNSEIEKCMLELQHKSDALEDTGNITAELRQGLAEKTIELENCLQKMQRIQIFESIIEELKTSLAERNNELEKCLMERQQKSEALEATEASVEELRQTVAEKTLELEGSLQKLQQMQTPESFIEELKTLVAEKTNDLETCLLELQQKTNALDAAEVRAEELRHMLGEKTTELENCLQQLQHVQNSEGIVEELKISLAEKTHELQKYQLELQQTSGTSQTDIITSNEPRESQDLLKSLQERISERDQILQELEKLTQDTDFSEDLQSMTVVDRVRWFVNQKHELGRTLLDNSKIRESISSIELPENISSTELDSQIYWLVKSFTQAKEDTAKLQEEIAGARLSLSSHETELLETQKEVDHLAASLLEVKHEKDFLQEAHENLRIKYKKVAEKLSSIFSETGEMVKEPAGTSMRSLDYQSSLDTDPLIEKCIDTVSQRIKAAFTEREQFEEMKSLLFVKCLEQRLCEKILEEDTVSKPEITALSVEIQRASEEVITLRNEKEALQKELERVEEKTSLIREKLSMAVKKGKGLVQEREGLKHSLEEKNSEIEKLKKDVQLQESAIAENKKQIESLSASQEDYQILESEIASLKELREQNEKLLQESNNMVQMLVKSIEEVVLPSDKIFASPVEKVYWIAEHMHESEVSRARLEQEVEELKSEASSHVTKLADASSTIKSLEDELCKAETHIYNITQEHSNLQLAKVNVEQEFEKMKAEISLQASKLGDAYAVIRSLEDEVGKMYAEEEFEKLKEVSSMQASKLQEAYETVKSLEDAVTQASRNISILEAEKLEIESESKQEIVALNAKLADCTKELVEARNALGNQSGKLGSHFGELEKIVKDKGLFLLMTEEFKNNVDGLKHMGILIQDLHVQFTEKGLRIHNGLEHDFTSLPSPLPDIEDFINDAMFDRELSTEGLDDMTALSKIVQGFHSQAKLLGSWFHSLSRYMDENITMTGQALQAAKDEFFYMLELYESLKLHLDSLEARNLAQETEMSSSVKKLTALLSASQEAIQELEIDFGDSLELQPEEDIVRPVLTPSSSEAAFIEAEECAKVAESLLLVSKRTGLQAKQLMRVNRVLVTSVNELTNKFKQAELTAETAIQERNLSQERALGLEKDLKELQNICIEMERKLEDNQAREDMLRDREFEISSLQNVLASKGTGESLIPENQVEVLLDKLNKVEVSFHEPTTEIQEVHFSNPMEKLFYILDNFTKLQHRLDVLTYEKEDMQLIHDSHLREMEHLKKTAATSNINFQDLESKKMDLVELTIGLEKILQRFGAKNLYEDQKPDAPKGLLPMLERLIMTSNSEVENLRSRLQELGAKLHSKEKVIYELSAQNKLLEDSIEAQLAQPVVVKERAAFDVSTTSAGSEISEIEDAGPPGKKSLPPLAPHVRSMRKGSSDHLVLSIDADTDLLLPAPEVDDKGHIFKSLHTSGLIPRHGKLIADRLDGIWVSGGRSLMSRPRARLGLIAYWIFLHLWLLGTIL